LLKRALAYSRFDPKIYRDLLRAFVQTKSSDTMPEWEFPGPLPPLRPA